MKIPLLAFMLFAGFCTSAQVMSTSKDKAGTITRSIRLQFGEDTIQMGVPFHIRDKPGLMISVSQTEGKSYFSFDLRTCIPTIVSDSAQLPRTSLVFRLANNDTIKILPSGQSRFDNSFRRDGQYAAIFLHAYLTDRQIRLFKKNKVAGIYFCKSEGDEINLPITHTETVRLRTAMRYLSN